MMFATPPGRVVITAPSASLVGLMSRFTARPVVDMTGIEGLYDFKLLFAPEINGNLITGGVQGREGEATSVEPVPSVFDAVKQYGLRLEARKSPAEMLTVTHLEKTPTEN
jgi:uncharacterized protein (TIGR03435 family)